MRDVAAEGIDIVAQGGEVLDVDMSVFVHGIVYA